ncbi:MAG TPA: nuclear transport factor 2 family protein, partial [Pyrinomonadaceae bacterium]|nr:nuclear transport factor 2 family protein [Pyrinomonadaceae bacterium]
AATVKMIGQSKCDVKTMNYEDPQMATIDADTAVITYKATFDGTCNGPDGKAMKVPSPVRSASVYIREGDKWMGLWHGEVPITDQPKPMPPPPAPAPAKSDNKNAANSNTMANANSNENKAAAPASGPNTDALAAIEKQGWDAWKDHDAKKLGDLTTSSVSFVDLTGKYAPTKDDTIKMWTGGACEVKSTSVTDTSSAAISPTLNILFFKGTADGTCGGQKVLPIEGTSFYVKEGDTWKLAFGFETPA